MKLNKVLFSQVIRILKISGPGGGSIYGLNLTKACEARYGFLEAPRVLADYDLSKGVTFLHGYFHGRFVIDKFQVFGNGVLVEAKVRTDECEEFIDDVIEWVMAHGGIEIDASETKSFYVSQVEVELIAALSEAFSKFRDFGHQVSNVIRSYGHILPDMEVSALVLSADPVAQFKIERREGAAPNACLYFCAAPLRTADHLGLLENVETILFKTTAS
jgi:hypothetical protein